MNKNKITRDHVKKAARFLVGTATATTVRLIVKNNAHPATRIQNAQVTIGAVVIGSIVSDLAEEHTSLKVDELADAIAKIKSEVKEAQTN